MLAENLDDFFKNLGIKALNVSKKSAKIVSKNPERALDITANLATKTASTNPKTELPSLPEVLIFLF